MAVLTPLAPDADGTVTGVTDQAGGTTNLYAVVTDGLDSTYLHPGVDLGGDIFLRLSDVDADFGTMDTLAGAFRVSLFGTITDDTTTLTAQVFDGNGTGTPLTDSVAVANQTSSGTFTAYTPTFTISGTPSKAQWNNAYLRLVWVYTKNKASDGIELRVSEAHLTGTYTAAAAGTYTGTLAVTDTTDTLAASGTVTAPTVTGTVAVTDSADTLTASGTVVNKTFTDSFTRADGALGGDWTGTGWAVATNQAESTSSAVVNVTSSTFAITQGHIDNGFEVQASMSKTGQYGIGVWVGADQANHLFAHLAVTSSAEARLGTYASDVYTEGSHVAYAHDYNTFYTIKVTVSAGTARLYINDAEVTSVAWTPTVGDVVGLRSADVGTSTFYADDFAAQELTASPVTGTVAVTDGLDTLTASGAVSAPSASGTLSVTDSTDTLAAAGTTTSPTITGTLSSTDLPDTITASGTVTSPVVTGTLGVQDEIDTLSASGTATSPSTPGTLNVTDGRDTLAASGTVEPPVFTGTLSASDSTDTLTASGTVASPSVTGTVTATDGLDTLTAAGTITTSGVVGTLGVTDSADTLSAAGTVTVPAITGTLAATDSPDTLVASGTYAAEVGGPTPLRVRVTSAARATTATTREPANGAASAEPDAAVASPLVSLTVTSPRSST